MQKAPRFKLTVKINWIVWAWCVQNQSHNFPQWLVHRTILRWPPNSLHQIHRTSACGRPDASALLKQSLALVASSKHVETAMGRVESMRYWCRKRPVLFRSLKVGPWKSNTLYIALINDIILLYIYYYDSIVDLYRFIESEKEGLTRRTKCCMSYSSVVPYELRKDQIWFGQHQAPGLIKVANISKHTKSWIQRASKVHLQGIGVVITSPRQTHRPSSLSSSPACVNQHPPEHSPPWSNHSCADDVSAKPCTAWSWHSKCQGKIEKQAQMTQVAKRKVPKCWKKRWWKTCFCQASSPTLQTCATPRPFKKPEVRRRL